MTKPRTRPRVPALGLRLLLLAILPLAVTRPASAQGQPVASSQKPVAAVDEPPPRPSAEGHSSPRRLDLEVRRYRRVKLTGTTLLALYVPLTVAASALLSATQRTCGRRCSARPTPVPVAGSLFTAPVLIGAATAFAIGRRRLRHLDYATPTISLSTHGIALGFGATF